jgi:hypothetical protein
MPKKQIKCGLCGEHGHKRNNRYFHPVEGKEVKPKKEKKKREGGVGGASLKNEENFIHNFNTNSEFLMNFIQKSGLEGTSWTAKKPTKKEGFTIIQTDTWKNYKSGTRECAPTPKTDVVLINNETGELVGLSIKSGVGRATSADAFETGAILLSVLEEFPDNIDLESLVKEMVEGMLKKKLTKSELNMTQMKQNFADNPEGLGFDKEFLWYTNFINSCQTCNGIWRLIVENFPEFKYAVIKECLVGKHKFGKNIGKADLLVVLESSTSVNLEKVINLKESNPDLNEYCSKIGNGNCFAAKSSGSTLWMRFL